jgi:hypothetical protein
MTLLMWLFACQVPGPSYSGHGTYDYLAFDGERVWKYQSEDPETTFTLVVEKTDYLETEGLETITFEYSTEDPQQLLGSITWESGGINGTGITAYTVDDEEITFDTMIGFANNRMVGGDFIDTQTNGATFTSTMLGLEPCPNNWSSDEWECLHFNLTVDQADHSFPFIGDYWMANGWGASRLNIPSGAWGSTEDWILIGADWELSED